MQPSRCATSTGAAGSTAISRWFSGISISLPRTRWVSTNRCVACSPSCVATSRLICLPPRIHGVAPADLEGDRPPLSIDIVAEFLMPILDKEKAAAFIVIDCLRLDQWRALEPVIAPLFDIETTHYFGVLPTATPYARNALFSGLFPNEIAARFPDWWGEREDETLNAHEKDLLEAHLKELNRKVPVKYDKISSSYEADEIERRLANAIAPEGISAFVFNFVDLLTHGRSESAILYEVARDEIALRQLTLQWFKRSALFSVLQEARRRNVKVLVTSDHGSIHCHTPATVFAKRDATQNLRYKFGEDLRAENPEYALLFKNEDALKLPRRGLGANTLLATGDSFFVYPTKLREYQSRYRGSFLHGGVTPEECILPVSLLTPDALTNVRATARSGPASAFAGGWSERHRLQHDRRGAGRLLVHAARAVPERAVQARAAHSTNASRPGSATLQEPRMVGAVPRDILPTDSALWRR